MEAIGALASTLQIIGQCAQATVTIARWVGQVKTVDARIESFSNEVSGLQSTYQSLNQSLNEPSVVKAARLNDYDATGHLWMQISTNLRDCERTVLSINQVLVHIESKARIGRPILKQLKESLVGGELARLRQQIQLFNTGMTLPMQMINLMMQLSQRDETSANQRLLDQRLDNLQRTLQTLTIDLSRPRRKFSYGGSTAVAEEMEDKTVYANLEGYIETAKAFLKSASIAASTRAGTSIGHQDEEFQEKSPVEMRRGSAWAPLTSAEVSRIENWGQNLPDDSLTPQISDAPSSTSAIPETALDSDDEDDEIELTLARTLLRNGHNEIEHENYPSAEDNFRAALDLVQSHDFGNNIACSPGDVTLLLAQCCMKQQKYDEAITRLEPLAAVAGTDLPQPSSSSSISQTRRHTDKGQALFASHMLGEIYLKKSDFINAERHTLKAHKGRRKLLGPRHPKTLESVQLAIDLYQAKGSEAMSNAYREFLKVPSESKTSLASPSLQFIAPVTSVPDSPPLSEPFQTQKRKTTFSIPMPFRKSQNAEVLTRSVPTSAPRVSFNAPYGPADSVSQFSSSPGNTSTFSGMDPLLPPNPHALRKSSTYSNASASNTTGWFTLGAEGLTEAEQRRRTSSQTKSFSLPSTATRQTLEPKFLAIRSFCQEGKHRKAVDMALTLFSSYDPDSAILVHRSAELEKTIKKSESMGLAGTGYGYAPIHFFCSLKQEAVAEVNLLIEHGANVNAVAHKAGYKDADPFTPLTAAVERGHENLVRLLLESKASHTVPRSKSSMNAQIDRNVLHPILSACRRGNVGIVSLLLEHGAVLQEDEIPRSWWHGNSLLHEACWRCNIPMVKFLLDYQRRNCVAGKPLSATVGRAGQQDSFGMTPLMYAIDMRDAIDEQRRAQKLRYRLDCLKLLLEDDCEDLQQRRSSGDDDETEDGVFVGHMDGTSPVFNQPNGSGSSRLATDLYIEDKRGRSVFWYADEDKDPALKELLELYSTKSRLIDFE